MTKKTHLQIIQQACGEMNIAVPQTAISSSDPSVMQLNYLLFAAADDLLKEFNWQATDTTYSFQTVPGKQTYTLPSDYFRMIDGTVFDQTNHWPLRGPKNPTEWQWLASTFIQGGPIERWRIQNGLMEFLPVPSATLTIAFEYASTNYVIDGNTGFPKQAVTQDSDIYSFDSRLLIYLLKLKYRESKGLDTTTFLIDYQRALAMTLGSDVPGQTLSAAPIDSLWLIGNDNIKDGSW